MAITTNLVASTGKDLGNNLFAGNGTSSGNQTFNIIQSNGVDLGKAWYNKTSCRYSFYEKTGSDLFFKTPNDTDIARLLGYYGSLNCDCDCNCNCMCDSDTDSDSD